MRLLALLTTTAAALTFAAPGSAQTAAAAAVDYKDQSNWICLPGRQDLCAEPLATTALNANGYGSTGQARPARDPKVDCFYVYPTVSMDQSPNSDLKPGPEDTYVVKSQFARFAGVCRPFAPSYRQVTLTALRNTMAGKPEGNVDQAYGDVRDAWREYLAAHNEGRPFVLIGHSQGTIHLNRLLAEEIEKSEAHDRLLSAMLIGYNVEVPEGKLVGGTFQKTPLCTEVGQTGCVVTYVSFPADQPPPAQTLFGRSARPGMTVACTNPARLARGSAPLDSYWYVEKSPIPSTAPQIQWSSAGAPSTPYLRTEGLATAACVNRGGVGYLAVSVNPDPKDGRTDVIPGRVHAPVPNGPAVPGWGLHLSDMNVAQGDLIGLIEAQAESIQR